MKAGWSFSGNFSFLASTLASLSSSFVCRFLIFFVSKIWKHHSMSICLQFCFSTPCSRTKPVCSHVFHMLLCPHLQVQLCSLYPLQILPFPHLGFLPCAASCSHVPAQNPLLWLHLTHVVPHTVYQVLIIFCVNLCLPQFHVLLQQASLQQLRKKGSKKK